MTGKTYDTQALIQAYIDCQRSNYPRYHDYYSRLVRQLETLFGVALNEITFNEKDRAYYENNKPKGNLRQSWKMFSKTIENLNMLDKNIEFYRWTPVDWFYDKEVNVALHIIFDASTSLKQGYLQLLHVIFEQVFGPIALTISSGELLALGFDDTTDPNLDEGV
jgi:hypothetical protein